MLKIPYFLDKENYLQNPIMKKFCKEHHIDVPETRADYLKAVTDYANSNTAHEEETKAWILEVAKEGSKEFCYKKFQDLNPLYKNYDFIKEKIKDLFPNCPNKSILDYKNTYEKNMINYIIMRNNKNEVTRISFTYSRLALSGDLGTEGEETVYPLFIDIYFDNSFIVSRGKAKSTLYGQCKDNIITIEHKIDTQAYATGIINDIIAKFNLNIEHDKKIIKSKHEKAFYKLYKEFTFTPEEVAEKVKSSKETYEQFINDIFGKYNLSIKNKPDAIKDIEILLEKYISINGDIENIFKEDRNAYLFKIGSDNEQEMTRVDTASNPIIPLQCTDIFFDSKKYIMKAEKCNKINLCFKRTDSLYFGKDPICVQFMVKKDYGIFKITNYAKEVDIENVLQTIFKHY